MFSVGRCYPPAMPTTLLALLLLAATVDPRLAEPLKLLAEDGARVEVTVVDRDGDHSVFALFKGGGSYAGPRPDGGLGIGRYFRPDELEAIDPPS